MVKTYKEKLIEANKLFANLLIFLIAASNHTKSEIQIFLILISIIFYLLLYRNLIVWKFKSVITKE